MLMHNRPIMSYSNRGCVDRADACHHSIAYTSESPPDQLHGEDMDRIAIKINSRNGETLRPTSRINYSKVYTIEHNLRVKDIGKVAEGYFEWVVRYYRESNGV